MKPPANFRGAFRTDELARALYSEGAGIGRAMPSAVAVPQDASDVSALVRWAAAEHLPLVPRGSGSGMAGGAVGDGVIVDLGRLRTIGTVDAERRTIRAGAGVLCADVDRAARTHGLRFPVDPSSAKFASVGGMAATNAAGARSLRHGTMRPWVGALDVVFDDGNLARIGRGSPVPRGIPAVERFERDVAPSLADILARHVPAERPRKNSSGYALAEYARSGELADLLVGSEGTLGLFVGLELLLQPVPAATSSLLALFASLEHAVDAAATCRELGASACELLDRTFLEVAHQGDAAVPVAETALLIEVEGDSAAAAAARAERLRVACATAAATEVRVALDSATEESLWSLRHAASPMLARLDPSLKSMQFIEDGALPPHRLPEYVRGVRAALARREIRGIIFGHAGDAHVHVNALVDVRRPDWREAVEAVLEEVVELTASLGGTLAGEHGDGRLRTPLLEHTWPAEMVTLFARVKESFDPAGILNPGVKVALPAQRAIDIVKYDPTAPPLPHDARVVLDELERERAWHRHRLSLVGGSD